MTDWTKKEGLIRQGTQGVRSLPAIKGILGIQGLTCIQGIWAGSESDNMVTYESKDIDGGINIFSKECK